MQEFQRSLLEDLRERVVALQARITDASSDPDLAGHANDVRSALGRVDATVRRMLADPGLGRPELDRQHRAIYQRLNENVFILESYMVPPIERFNQHDRRLTRMVRKLGEQLNWPLPTPLVVADSSSYYMTFPSFQLMKVPAGESQTMLAYPDLVHEMTHILMVKERGKLLGDFVNVLSAYVATEQRQQLAPLQPHVFEQWRSLWLEEFVCDMVAVYSTGKSFGEQHIRLVSGMAPRSFTYGKSHPPDEARVRGAIAVMKAMGNMADAQEIDDLWREYLPTTGEAKPKDYDRIVPDQLIDALAQRVVAGCRQLNIRTYDAPAVAKPDDIVGMVSEGWRRFRSDPLAFMSWQRARLSALWQELGADPPRSGAALPPPVTPLRPRQRPAAVRPVSSASELAA